MKKLWVALYLAALLASFTSIAIKVGPYALYANSAWTSSTIFARVTQGVVLMSLLGFLRDLSKKPGRVSSRLFKRTFIILGFYIGLYLPWDGLEYQMDLWIKVLFSLVGAVVWFLGFMFLVLDDESPAIPKRVNDNTTTVQAPAPAPVALATPAKPAAKVKPKTGICPSCNMLNPTSGNYCKRCGLAL
jgi:ribosomal protein L40E